MTREEVITLIQGWRDMNQEEHAIELYLIVNAAYPEWELGKHKWKDKQ